MAKRDLLRRGDSDPGRFITQFSLYFVANVSDNTSVSDNSQNRSNKSLNNLAAKVCCQLPIHVLCI